MRVLLLAIALSSPHAHADLYRWVERETGAVKFSSAPPPWYGDPEKARGAPKVEVIPYQGSAQPAKPPAKPPPAPVRK